MILIAVGSNLGSARFGGPLETCAAALAALDGPDIRLNAQSRWYRSAPVPPSDQPWFINAVAEVDTRLSAERLLARLHDIEREFGRVRRQRNEARIVDLDLLAYHDVVTRPGSSPELPHPRIAERAFVLLPLADIAPGWRHPANGATLGELTASLPSGQITEVVRGAHNYL